MPKRYLVLKCTDIRHVTDDKEEALTVAKNARGGKYTFIVVYDLVELSKIYEWYY